MTMANRLIRTTTGALALTLILALVTAGSPDLVVARVDAQPLEPLPGAVVSISATIANVGTSAAEGEIFVRFTVDGEELNTSLIFGLAPEESETVATAWIAVGGRHTIGVEVDRPYQRIGEEDESNNSASITIPVQAPALLPSELGGLRIAVARFEDDTGSGFVNVGEGVADKLADRLCAGGVRVLRRGELEEIMQERGLDPLSIDGIIEAASLLGADVAVTGRVEGIDRQQVALNIAFFRFASASADVAISATPIRIPDGAPLFTVSTEGHAEGTSGPTIGIGNLLSATETALPCQGGLRTDRPWYRTGEIVSLGYSNPSPSGWYSLEIHATTGTFIRWLGWEYIESGSCGRWFWDQKDSARNQVPPAIYVAKLWNGTSYVASITFQIRPEGGGSIEPLEGVAVGTKPFDESVVGAALDRAIEQLADQLTSGLAEAGITPMTSKAAPGPLLSEGLREGQLAAVLPDGRIAINIGAAAGVEAGDRFAVLETENLVIDPETLSLIGYEAVGVKGEILIVEVHEDVSYAVSIGEFAPEVGDVVRPLEPRD